MRVLVTNDDGVGAVGLRVLAQTLHDAGHDVVVVAPQRDCSGQSAALGPLHITGTIDFESVVLPGFAGRVAAVDGPPALCVMAACLDGFGRRPDVVVSGINAGANSGRAVLHSGTVGAALTGLNFGIPGVAVSQVAGDQFHWKAAADLAACMVTEVRSLPLPVVLNLNVPNLPVEEIRDLVTAELDTGGTVEAVMIERREGQLALTLPTTRSGHRPGSDSALLEAGHATLTALAGPHAVRVQLDGACRRADTFLSGAAQRQPA